MRQRRNPANAKFAKGEKIELKRAEEERLQVVIDAMGDGLVLVNMDGKIIAVNPAMEKMGGYTKSEVVGKDATDLISKVTKPEGSEKIMRALGTTLKGKSSFSGTYTFVTKDGREIPVASTASFVKDVGGKTAAIVVTYRDITELKRAEEALRGSERRFRELADSITDVFFAMDKDLRYTYWNKASEKLTGIQEKDAIGKSIFELFSDNEETRRAVKVYQAVLKTGHSQAFVIEYHLRGKKFFFEISAYPSKDGLSVFVKDITERKKAEEERLKAAADRQRMEELEKFAKIAVDRELKMVGLKTRIKELEEKLEAKS